MHIKILWHRIWVNFAFSGLCEKDDKLCWFEWDYNKKCYLGFVLSPDQIEKVDEERERLEKTVGKVIYHDERYSPILSISEKSFIECISLSNVKFEKESFTFQKEDVVNPTPSSNRR